jgi:hypothetical protein
MATRRVLPVSPYSYAYDLAMLGAAAALLADTVGRGARGREAAPIGAGFAVAGSIGRLTGLLVGVRPSATLPVHGEPVPVVGPAVLAVATTTVAVPRRAGPLARAGDGAPAPA